MSRNRGAGRLGTLTLTMLIALGIAVGQPLATSADEKLGETAIGAAMDQLESEPAAEETEAPPAEEAAPPADESGSTAPPADNPPATDTSAPPADSGGAAPASSEGASGGESAPATTDAPAPADTTVQAQQVAPATSGPQTVANSINPLQQLPIDATQSDGDNDADQTSSPSLTEAATANVLSGSPALNELALPVAGGLQAAANSDEDSDEDSGEEVGSNAASSIDSGSDEDASGNDADESRTSFRAASDNLQRATLGPARNREDGERRNEPDNGTVVVNNLSDAGDQGKVAVHGHIVAGTLCDGSQFWSLDGGGTVNANGVTLSANGGTALADGSAGNNNIAGGGGSAGNGGRANASADGGIVVVDELVTGNNRGNQVTVGDETFTGDCGQGVIDGGDATTVTNVNISADGGTAIADASGGDNNVALGDGANAGNGGRANASADGGIVVVGDLILGNNEGNTINASGSGAGGGGCFIDGGTVRNRTNIDISADGGTALADASGGDDNVALGDDANAGNGGRANANADGGLILAGDIITGNNQGNTIDAQCGGGSGRVMVNGGSVLNETNITLNADGGVAVADASGGDNNIAGGIGGDAAAGNGGRAEADASGGIIRVGNIVTGNNTGNVIALGANFAPVPSNEPKPMRTISKKPTGPAAHPKPGSGQAPQGTAYAAPAARPVQSVGKLPNTGTGSVEVAGATSVPWLFVAALTAAGAIFVGHSTRRGPAAVARATSSAK